MENKIIGNKYFVLNKIGNGSFGSIFKGENQRTKELVAIKIEPIHQNTKLLKNESNIYQYLKDLDGIPNVKWYGKDELNYYMVIPLLGESLQSWRDINKNNKVINNLSFFKDISIQILYLLESIHKRGVIHRDIKPDNFLFGRNENKHQLHVIDFGICKRFTNDNGEHMKMNKIKKIIGSLNYCSINSHQLNELSRRDDLEMLGYVLINISCGSLIWKTYSCENEIMKRKILLTSDIKIPGIPDVFITYLKYVKKLGFEEKPDYEFIRDLFTCNQDK